MGTLEAKQNAGMMGAREYILSNSIPCGSREIVSPDLFRGLSFVTSYWAPE